MMRDKYYEKHHHLTFMVKNEVYFHRLNHSIEQAYRSITHTVLKNMNKLILKKFSNTILLKYEPSTQIY